MARIGIDGTPICLPVKGLTRYLMEFLEALSENPGPHQYSIFLRQNSRLPKLPDHPRFNYVQVSFSFGLAWEMAMLPKISRRLGLNLIHTPLERGLFLRGIPAVVYLFEIPDHRMKLEAARPSSSYQKFSRGLSKFLFPFALRKTDHIMTGSQFTRGELERKYRIPPDKISLVYPGCNKVFHPAADDVVQRIRAKWGAPQGYVLHFSSDDPRDNSGVVLDAYAKTVKQISNPPPLFIKAAQGDRETLMARCGDLHIAERTRFLGYQSQRDLVELYQGAIAYVDPSLFEGFGFQVAEAMACGIPVIASNTASLPEVVGEAGMTASPGDVEAFSRALVKILCDGETQRSMSSKSLAQSAKFSWKSHVAQTLEVYKQVLP